MANAFDQFDAQPAAASIAPANGNAFDQFDAGAPVTATGLTKSFGVGVPIGALGLLSSFVTRSNPVSMPFEMINDARRLIGGSPSPDDAVNKFNPAAPLDRATDATLSAIQGLHQPQNIPEQYAQTAGSFLPALFGGEASAIPRLAELAPALLRRVAVPAVASETAGQLTAGTKAEPIARALTAVGAGWGAAPRVGAIAPTVDELTASARGPAGYGSQAVQDLRIQPAAVNQLADAIATDLQGSGYRARNVGGTFGALDELRGIASDAAQGGAAPTAADIDSVRRSLRVTAQGAANPMSPNHAEYGAASRAISMIDDYMASLQPTDLLSGDAQAASGALASARGDYGAASRAERLDEAQYRAENNAGAANSGQNVNNAMRQQLKTILNSPAQRRGYSPDEIAQMESVVRGTYTGNAARFVGNLFGGSALGALASGGAGFVAGGPVGMVALPLAGQVARQVGNASTARNIAALNDMVRMRSPLGAQRAAAAPPSGLSPQQAALLAALAVLRRQQAGAQQ